MKRFWISVTVLAVIFAITLANSWYLDHLTGQMSDTLKKAQQFAEDGDWDTARALTQNAKDIWNQGESYLYIVLRHNDADSVLEGFQEVEELLQWEEEAEYTSVNARLVEDIRLLAEMEAFSIKNLL